MLHVTAFLDLCPFKSCLLGGCRPIQRKEPHRGMTWPFNTRGRRPVLPCSRLQLLTDCCFSTSSCCSFLDLGTRFVSCSFLQSVCPHFICQTITRVHQVLSTRSAVFQSCLLRSICQTGTDQDFRRQVSPSEWRWNLNAFHSDASLKH